MMSISAFYNFCSILMFNGHASREKAMVPNHERLAETLAGFHLFAFAMLFARRRSELF